MENTVSTKKPRGPLAHHKDSLNYLWKPPPLIGHRGFPLFMSLMGKDHAAGLRKDLLLILSAAAGAVILPLSPSPDSFKSLWSGVGKLTPCPAIQGKLIRYCYRTRSIHICSSSADAYVCIIIIMIIIDIINANYSFYLVQLCPPCCAVLLVCQMCSDSEV